MHTQRCSCCCHALSASCFISLYKSPRDMRAVPWRSQRLNPPLMGSLKDMNYDNASTAWSASVHWRHCVA